jgi:hypothetical protein
MRKRVEMGGGGIFYAKGKRMFSHFVLKYFVTRKWKEQLFE